MPGRVNIWCARIAPVAAAFAQAEPVHTDTIRTIELAVSHSVGGRLVETGGSMKMYDWDRAVGHNVIYRPSGVRYMDVHYVLRADSAHTAHGPFTYYNEDGTVGRQGTYIMGKKSGTWTFNDEHGALISKKDFATDRVTTYWPSGGMRAEGPVEEMKTGEEERMKEWRFYHPNGKLMCTGRFDLWGKRGRWSYYDEQGKELKQERYPRPWLVRFRPLTGRKTDEEACDCIP